MIKVVIEAFCWFSASLGILCVILHLIIRLLMLNTRFRRFIYTDDYDDVQIIQMGYTDIALNKSEKINWTKEGF